MSTCEKMYDMIGNELQIGDHVIIARCEHLYNGILVRPWLYDDSRIIVNLSGNHTIIESKFNIIKIDTKHNEIS
jgi:hypothetical protein